MSSIFKRLSARKPIHSVSEEVNTSEYKRPLTAFDLTMLGVGAIMGAGIFVLTGKAARENAGPAIILSFVISGFVCAFACLCYAELGSTLPVSGSAYSFTYAALGEVLAWIVGWDLMLEYLVGAAAVAVGWTGYLDIILGGFAGRERLFDPRFFPAFIIVIVLSALLCMGIRESSWLNNTLVFLNLTVCSVFILSGIKFINPANYSPFIPPEQGHGHYGMSGVFQGSITVFFAYIGFDAVTTTAQEAANPQRDLPIGICASLAICTVFYVAVSAVLTGMVHYSTIDLTAPVSQALIDVGMPVLAVIISCGILSGLSSVLLVSLIGQPRIFYSMAYDGLFPAVFATMDQKKGIPYVATIVSGIVCAFLAGLLPVDLLGNLTSVGTLSAFFLVSVSTLVLRITEPDLPRKFEIPGGFWFGGIFIPFLSAFFSAGLFSQATVASIGRVFIWMAVGLVLYACYGYHHSKLGRQMSGKMTLSMDTKIREFKV
ncbi:hypothetical protein BATDEDRAFT_11532 [Batrachochytrium dendrobatidis JAM81]|uniref:Cationic amino acid transporter C-terminal domain-containing protein n=1 Tax=Batrachochytrium dendrobatidis (strain JAM81 / FGSC 10211) TaxID=684364 RepID=F4P3D6_BATDJ|nr:uncharacterized protein BATDEDRAFT_11532 [Batrachochytrium dendrobatidis JAM81]EGF80448.1 hypothetical protein BATDEDRAFT_11532 [Batrachochytrium dendrobatidis JAM81]|eukprot:XP_006678866.1 hypothetical protein BATDEDRAFT_11532 [Batrachochytrium dendrobatidis JAM81]